MTPKSLVYMVVAVFVGYMLVSAVPGQVAMYTVPTPSLEKGDTITLTGTGFSHDNESSSVEENGSVVLYWDSVNLTDGREFSVDNETIYFEIVRTNGSNGFWVNNETISLDIDDLSAEIEELSEFEEESDAIDAVYSVASTASEASEAANAAKSASSGLEFMGTMVGLTVDVFIALVVYWFAKRRFA